MNEFSRENAEISQCFRKSIIFKYLKSAFQNHHFFQLFELYMLTKIIFEGVFDKIEIFERNFS